LFAPCCVFKDQGTKEKGEDSREKTVRERGTGIRGYECFSLILV